MNNSTSSKSTEFKPIAFEIPTGYPYNLLPTGQQFEKLLYHIFKARIEKESGFSSHFDRAFLMPGGSEQGRDVMLTLNGIPAGLIQCKKEVSNLSDTECAKEIIKFILHTIRDSSLMPDASRFVYHLAVSSGLTVTATDLIATSRTSLPVHPKLQQWTQAVIKENKKLHSFTYDGVVQSLIAALKKIQIEPIFATDLDLWLSQYPEIVPGFFRGGGSQEIKPLTSFASPISHRLILERFQSVSVSLKNCPSIFSGLPGSHIKRIVTQELFEWLTKSNSELMDVVQENMRVGILVDDAGYGKTTVMKDVYDMLQTANVPTLALKADMLPFTQRSTLTNELQLMDDPERLVNTLCEDFDRIVVLIDQLDALSQHQSADRQPLRMFNQLISQLSVYPQVRLLIACRRFDLQYDPVLASIKHKFERKVGPLTREEVEGVCKQLGFSADHLTDSLYELLKIPHHINVFCQVYESLTDFSTLQSVQDLYRELWQQKLVNLPISKNVSGKLIRQCIKQLALDMHERQQVILPYVRYEDQYSEALNYLQSEGILTYEKQTLRFFHQSFFDYVFARAFVEQNGQLSVQILGEEGIPKHQGLFIRSQVRQVLSYLRDVDPDAYITQLKSFLIRSDVRYHLKLLIIQSFAYQSAPTMAEKQVVRQVISIDDELWSLFLESVGSPAWFAYLLSLPPFQTNLHLAESIVYKQLQALCWRVQKQDMNLVINFLQTLPNDPAWDHFIIHLLYTGPSFTGKTALGLFDRVEARNKIADLWYFRVVERGMNIDPEWASQKIIQRIYYEQGKLPSNKKDHIPVEKHSFLRAIDKLHEQAPAIAIETSLIIIRQLITASRFKQDNSPEPDLYNDWSFCEYNPRDRSDIYTHYDLNTRVRKWLRELVITSPNEQLKLVIELLSQPSTTLIKIGLDVVQAAPSIYSSLVFERLMQKVFLIQMNEISYLPYDVAETLRQTYPYFSTSQQQQFIERLLALRVPSEQEISTYSGRKYYRKKVGLAQYSLMIVLPKEAIESFPKLKSRYQELTRKFEKYEHKAPSRRSGTIRGNVLSDKAYAAMSLHHWLNSFAVYNNRKGSFADRWNQVSEHSHAQRLTEEVAKRPEWFITLLQALLTRPDLPNTYIFHGIGGLIKGHFIPDVVKGIIKQCIPIISDEQDLKLIISFVDYLINTECIDEDIFAFIQQVALSEADNETIEDDDALMTGINHPVGAATERLIYFAHFSPYVERVFSTFEKLAEIASTSTRAVMLHQLYRLIQHDRQRSLQLFLRLTRDFDSGLVHSTLASANHLMFDHFLDIAPFFKQSLNSQLPDDVGNWLGQLIAIAYVQKFSNSESILDMAEQTQKGDIFKGIIRIAMEDLIEVDSEKRERGNLLAINYLKYDYEEVAVSYRHSFDQYHAGHFTLLQTFLRKYVRSPAGRTREADFYDYLLKCVCDYPDECIELASLFDTHESPDGISIRLEYQPVEVVMQAYNAFRDYKYPNQSLEIAMNLFDRILKQSEYRNGAQSKFIDFI